MLDSLADPARVLSWRNHTGAPAPAAVRKQAEALRAEAEALHAPLPALRQDIEEAHSRCAAYRP